MSGVEVILGKNCVTMIALCHLQSASNYNAATIFEVPRCIVRFYRPHKGYHRGPHVYNLAGGQVVWSPRRHNLADDESSIGEDDPSNLLLNTGMP